MGRAGIADFFLRGKSLVDRILHKFCLSSLKLEKTDLIFYNHNIQMEAAPTQIINYFSGFKQNLVVTCQNKRYYRAEAVV